MIYRKETEHVVVVTQLDDFGEKLLKDLSNYQRNINLCSVVSSEDVYKAIKIIRKGACGHVLIYGKCENNQCEDN